VQERRQARARAPSIPMARKIRRNFQRMEAPSNGRRLQASKLIGCTHCLIPSLIERRQSCSPTRRRPEYGPKGMEPAGSAMVAGLMRMAKSNLSCLLFSVLFFLSAGASASNSTFELRRNPRCQGSLQVKSFVHKFDCDGSCGASQYDRFYLKVRGKQ